MPPSPVIWTFDLLTLKMVFESRVTWATCVPILVFLALSVLDLDSMYATDRQTDRRQPTDVRQHHRLMPPPRERGHNNKWLQTAKINASQAGCTCVRGTEKVKKTHARAQLHPPPPQSFFAAATVFWCMRSYGRRNHACQSSAESVQGFRSPRAPWQGAESDPLH